MALLLVCVYVSVSSEPGSASCPLSVLKTSIFLFFFRRVTTYIQVCECLTWREGGVCVCIRPKSVPIQILPVLMPRNTHIPTVF